MQHRNRSGVLALMVCISLLLAGCVTTSGGPPGQLRRTLQQAASAAFTVQTSFDQLRDGGTFPTTLSVTCDNMLEQAQNASKDASTLSVDTRNQHRLRSRVADAISTTSSLIVAVKDYISGTSVLSAAQLSDALSKNRKNLATLERATESAQ
jgi:hypothetical protein